MRIIKLIAENIKRLIAVEITPDGNVVEITGKNSMGKTSVLDSIWWALTGATHIQAQPIRKGASKARIKLDLGELIVTRVFNKAKAGGATTSITVEDANGKKVSSPQTILNSLVGELSFDPLAFSRMSGDDQLETLRRFVPDVDFDEIQKANDEDYRNRTDLNRQAKRARAQADGITIPKDCPKEPIDESALMDELQKAGEHNAMIEQRNARREDAVRAIENKKADAKRLHDQATIKVRAADDLVKEATVVDTEAKDAEEEAAAIEKKLADAPPLPDHIDATALRIKIGRAKQINNAIAEAKQKAEHVKECRKLEEQATKLTRSMENREAKKRVAIEKAKMPVKEITLGDGEVLLNGVPFDQASDAERLRVSVSIAMASNPKLRVIRVRDGSLLDEDSMKLLAEMADTSDYQIWIERVEAGSKTGIVLEDGMVKEQASE